MARPPEMILGTHADQTKEIPYELDSESLLVIGKKDSGKRALLVNLALQKIAAGEPIVFLDNDDEAIKDILDHMPEDRQKDVIYCSPSEFPFALNIFDQPAERYEALVLALNDAVRTVWRFDHVSTSNITETLIAGALTLLTVKGATLLHFERLYTDKEYRTDVVAKLTDPYLRNYWAEYESLKDDRERRERTRSTISKLRILGMLPTIRSCIGQEKNRLVFKDKIVLLPLKESELGSENAALIGALAQTTLYLEAVRGLRTTLFVRNTHRFVTGLLPALQDCTNLQTVISVKYLAQLGDYDAALLSGADKIVAFRTSQKDATALKSDFPLGDQEKKLHEQQPFDAMVSGLEVTRLHTYSHDFPKTDVRDRIVERCRRRCTTPDDAIAKRLGKIAERTIP